MFDINNEKRNQAMSLRGRAVGSDVVIFHAETEKALSLSGASSEKQKESSLILRKAKFQAIFKFVLSSASGGAGGGKYNLISAFVSMPVLLIRRSLEKFFKKNFRDDRFCFGSAKVKALSFLRLRGASGAQGISATASCREAHKRRFLFNSWILRFANAPLRITIPTIAFLLSLNISTSWAINCPAGTQGSDNVAASNSCGANCCWGIDANHVLTITPAIDQTTNKPFESVTMKTFSYTDVGTDIANGYTQQYSSNAPWARQGATSVVVENGISNIGINAFTGDTKITGVTGMENVTSIGDGAFYDASSLQGVYMPNVTTVGMNAFHGATSLQSVDMPNVKTIELNAFNGATSLQSVDMPNVTTVGMNAFNGASSLSYAGLNQDVRSLSIGSNAFYGTKISGCSRSNSANCNICTKSDANSSTPIYQPSTTGNTGSCVATCAGGYTASNGLCKKNPTQVAQNTTTQGGSGDTGGTSTGSDISGDFNPADCYNKGQVPYDNQCWNEYPFAKKRWTPAEANEWLHDGNDNFVVITFKK